MSLHAHHLETISKLARLSLSHQDQEALAKELNGILDLVDVMNTADVSHLEPLAHPLEAVQLLRPDVVSETDQRPHVMAGAPASEASLFLVPKVIE